MRGLKDIWEASVTISYRITYHPAGDAITLRIGRHETLKKETG